jgi:hypothetical protein
MDVESKIWIIVSKNMNTMNDWPEIHPEKQT